MIVAHGDAQGLIMPMGTALHSANKANLPGMTEMAGVVRERKRIKAIPIQVDRLKAWKELLRSVNGKVSPGGAIWGKNAPDLIDDLDSDAAAVDLLESSSPTILGKPMLKNQMVLDLIDLRNKVADLKFNRVEVRACNIGQDSDAMTALREFLGASRVLAPKVKTFYGRVSPSIFATDAAFKTWLRSNAPSLIPGSHAPPVPSSTRIYSYAPPKSVVITPSKPHVCYINYDVQVIPDATSFALKIWGSSQTCGARGKTATDYTQVKGFVDRYLNLKNSFPYSGGSFLIGGLDSVAGRTATNPPPAEAHGKAFLLPYETEYRDLIVSSP
jgi:hypothetical protein